MRAVASVLQPPESEDVHVYTHEIPDWRAMSIVISNFCLWIASLGV